MICPNLNDARVAQEFNELTSVLGDTIGYGVWYRNNGFHISYTPNGEVSSLFLALQDEYGREEAIRLKSRLYTTSFGVVNGKWWTGEKLNEQFDTLGEPIIDIVSNGKVKYSEDLTLSFEQTDEVIDPSTSKLQVAILNNFRSNPYLSNLFKDDPDFKKVIDAAKPKKIGFTFDTIKLLNNDHLLKAVTANFHMFEDTVNLYISDDRINLKSFKDPDYEGWEEVLTKQHGEGLYKLFMDRTYAILKLYDVFKTFTDINEGFPNPTTDLEKRINKELNKLRMLSGNMQELINDRNLVWDIYADKVIKHLSTHPEIIALGKNQVFGESFEDINLLEYALDPTQWSGVTPVDIMVKIYTTHLGYMRASVYKQLEKLDVNRSITDISSETFKAKYIDGNTGGLIVEYDQAYKTELAKLAKAVNNAEVKGDVNAVIAARKAQDTFVYNNILQKEKKHIWEEKLAIENSLLDNPIAYDLYHQFRAADKIIRGNQRVDQLDEDTREERNILIKEYQDKQKELGVEDIIKEYSTKLSIFYKKYYTSTVSEVKYKAARDQAEREQRLDEFIEDTTMHNIKPEWFEERKKLHEIIYDTKDPEIEKLHEEIFKLRNGRKPGQIDSKDLKRIKQLEEKVMAVRQSNTTTRIQKFLQPKDTTIKYVQEWYDIVSKSFDHEFTKDVMKANINTWKKELLDPENKDDKDLIDRIAKYEKALSLIDGEINRRKDASNLIAKRINIIIHSMMFEGNKDYMVMSEDKIKGIGDLLLELKEVNNKFYTFLKKYDIKNPNANFYTNNTTKTVNVEAWNKHRAIAHSHGVSAIFDKVFSHEDMTDVYNRLSEYKATTDTKGKEVTAEDLEITELKNKTRDLDGVINGNALTDEEVNRIKEYEQNKNEELIPVFKPVVNNKEFFTQDYYDAIAPYDTDNPIAVARYNEYVKEILSLQQEVNEILTSNEAYFVRPADPLLKPYLNSTAISLDDLKRLNAIKKEISKIRDTYTDIFTDRNARTARLNKDFITRLRDNGTVKFIAEMKRAKVKGDDYFKEWVEQFADTAKSHYENETSAKLTEIIRDNAEGLESDELDDVFRYFTSDDFQKPKSLYDHINNANPKYAISEGMYLDSEGTEKALRKDGMSDKQIDVITETIKDMYNYNKSVTYHNLTADYIDNLLNLIDSLGEVVGIKEVRLSKLKQDIKDNTILQEDLDMLLEYIYDMETGNVWFLTNHKFTDWNKISVLYKGDSVNYTFNRFTPSDDSYKPNASWEDRAVNYSNPNHVKTYTNQTKKDAYNKLVTEVNFNKPTIYWEERLKDEIAKFKVSKPKATQGQLDKFIKQFTLDNSTFNPFSAKHELLSIWTKPELRTGTVLTARDVFYASHTPNATFKPTYFSKSGNHMIESAEINSVDTAKTEANKTLQEMSQRREHPDYWNKLAIIQTQLQNGEITAEEFNEKYEEFHIFNPAISKYQPISLFMQNYPSDAKTDKYIESELSRDFTDIKVKPENENPEYKEDYKGRPMPTSKWKDSRYSKFVNKDGKIIDPLYEYLVSTIPEINGSHPDMVKHTGFLPVLGAFSKSIKESFKDFINWSTHNEHIESHIDINNKEYYKLIAPMMQGYTKEKEFIIPKRKDNETFEVYEKRIVEYANDNKRFTREPNIPYKNLKELQDELDRRKKANKDFTTANRNYKPYDFMRVYIKAATKYNFQKQMEKELIQYRLKLQDLKFVSRSSTGKSKFDTMLSKIKDTKIKAAIVKGDNAYVLKRATEWIVREFYGVEKDKTTIDKYMALFSQYAAYKYMALNIPLGVSNVLQGLNMVLSEATSDRFFGGKDVRFGVSTYSRATGDIFASKERMKSRTLAGALMVYMDIVDIYDERGLRQTDAVKGTIQKVLANTDLLFFLMHQGEHFIQNGTLFAAMNSHRVVGGKIMNFHDYFTDKRMEVLKSVLTPEQYTDLESYIAKRKGNEEYKWYKHDYLYDWIDEKLYQKGYISAIKQMNSKVDDIEKEAKAKFNTFETVFNQFELNENGYARIKKTSSLAKDSPDPTREIETFRVRIKTLNKTLQGVYDRIDANTLQWYTAGQVVMQFRKWMRPNYIRMFGTKWGKAKYNEALQEYQKGAYISLFQFLGSPVREAMMDADGKIAYKGILNLLTAHGKFVSSIRTRYNALSPFEKANIARANYNILAIVALAVMVMALAALRDGDDDDTYVLSVAIYHVYRLYTETTQLSPVGPLMTYQQFKTNPFAAERVFSDTADLAWNVIAAPFRSEAERQDGKHQDKIVKQLKKMPLVNSYFALTDVAQRVNYYKMYNPFNISTK